MELTATLRPVDQARGTRLMLAWKAGDQLAANNVLAEADADPIGTSGLVFTLTQTATNLATAHALNDADCIAQLRRAVLAFVIDGKPPDAA